MQAELVSITDTPEPTVHLKRLYDAEREAEEAVYSGLYQAGLLDRPYISPGADPQTQLPMHRLLSRLWFARNHVQSCLERRLRQLERNTRIVLDSDALSDEQRSTLLASLHGRRGRQRNSKILSEAEVAIVDRYRSMDAAGKQMLRTLCARLNGEGDAR